MAQARHLGNYLHTALTAICYKLTNGILRQEITVSVFKVDGILCPAEHILHFIGSLRISAHLLAVFYPAFVDFRMPFVLHCAADLDYDGVVAVVHQHIYNFVELVKLSLSRHIDLQTAERALRHCKTDSARDKAVVSLRLLKHLIYAVEQAALTLGADCDGVALSANGKRVLRVKLPLRCAKLFQLPSYLLGKAFIYLNFRPRVFSFSG